MREIRFIKLEEIITYRYQVFAHTNDIKNAETLEEHTVLCQTYYQKMIEERELENIQEEFLNAFLPNSTQLIKELFFEMIDQIITFHDTGKCNPAFQKQTMKNQVKQEDYDWLQGKNHSMLSAVIYINYYMNKIMEESLDKESTKTLKGLCLANGYIIARHHSELCDFGSFLDTLKENGIGFLIFKNMQGTNLITGTIIKKYNKLTNMWGRFQKQLDQEHGIYLYAYIRFFYSLLVSADYYATTYYNSGTKINDFGIIEDKNELIECYESAKLTKTIRNYKQNKNLSEINKLRTQMFLEAEESLLGNKDKNIYFLEAPTGSGKSNVSMNISFQLLKENYNKIFYVYPFNTLVEQNLTTLENIFGQNSKVLENIVVINSNTPIKQEKKKDVEDESDTESYKKALLDRQFLNYPFILTTHVSLFEIMFGTGREAIFGFSQLVNSVIVLDEIQSYKNTIWSEIILFLEAFAKILNIKVIIMSATLPDLTYLTKDAGNVIKFIKNRNYYFSNPLFKDRVKISYELLNDTFDLEILKNHLVRTRENKNVLIEFIKRKSAYAFYNLLKEDDQLSKYARLITGDDNQMERNAILDEIKENPGSGIILVATQVIEAGVDIDMDIGYKDISKLDSEEQFMGRINRSCKGSGIVYFFNLDDAEYIYRKDYRKNKELTLLDPNMQEILSNKNFEDYYQPVLDLIEELNESANQEDRLENFFHITTKGLDFPKVEKRMKLIEENDWEISVFLCRNIEGPEGILKGENVWSNYKKLLKNNKLDYAKRKVELSKVRRDMNFFIYKIKKNSDLAYHHKIGELYCIDNGDDYFINGKLNRDKLEQEGGMFLG